MEIGGGIKSVEKKEEKEESRRRESVGLLNI
jgi:hypothetical protein